MIVSIKNKFIFLSIVKTASTTSQEVLKNSGILGPTDIMSGYIDIPADGLSVRHYPENFPNITFSQLINEIQERPDLPEAGKPAKIMEILRAIYTPEQLEKELLHISLEHLTITEIIRLGLVTEIALPMFNVYGVIRDPIQRFLSSYFHFSFILNETTSINHLADYIDLIDPAFGPPMLMNKPYRSFFEYKGNLIATPILESQYQASICNLITSCGGTAPTEFPVLKNHYRPDWSRAPVESWMPTSSLTKLKLILEDDIDFYNQFKG